MSNDKIREYLISSKYLTQVDVMECFNRATINKSRIEEEILKTKKLPEETLTQALADFWNFEYLNINVSGFNSELANKIEFAYLKDFRVLPIKEENDKIIVAISNPYHFIEAINLEMLLNKKVKIGLISEDNMNNLLLALENKSRRKDAISNIKEDADSSKFDIEDSNITDAPSVVLADSFLKEAVASRASDIHIEPASNHVLIRYRIDGYLKTINKINQNLYSSLLARFKIIAGLNIAERRIPQDGKIRLKINGKDYDFRISTLPTLYGEKIVIRIYDITNTSQGIDSLGLLPEQAELFKKIIHRPFGIFLVTGPTGSGKTTTLYNALRVLNRGDLNLTTVEDPVENEIEGINQVQVNPKANLTFGTALRSILRQDPNVIMIGEIRDEETAQMAIRAAITGHLVLSTLHTNDALGSIARLVDMGIPRYLVADALIGVAAQRLVRKTVSNL